MDFKNLFRLFNLIALTLLSINHGVKSENQCICQINLSNTKETLRTLIDLSARLPAQDILLNITSLNQCEINCRIQAKTYLNYANSLEQQHVINYNINSVKESANKLCKLLNGEEIRNPGSNVNIKIKRKSDDSFIKDISMGRLCCNLPCSCQIKSSSTTTNSLVADFDEQIIKERIRGESFNCANELDECEVKCKKHTAAYLKYDPLKDIDYASDTNLFENNPNIGNFMCSIENRDIKNPGLDFYVKASTQLEKVYTPKYFYLGRVCCKRPCECKLVYNNQKSSTDGEGAVEMISLNSYLTPTEPFYNCDDESLICMKECRQAASVYFKEENLNKIEIPVSSLDLFTNFEIATDMCNRLYRVVEEPGINIYLRYSANGDINGINDLHLGRVCCKSFFEGFIPANRCGDIILPG
jgi:hypothetical protein